MCSGCANLRDKTGYSSIGTDMVPEYQLQQQIIGVFQQAGKGFTSLGIQFLIAAGQKILQ